MDNEDRGTGGQVASVAEGIGNGLEAFAKQTDNEDVRTAVEVGAAVADGVAGAAGLAGGAIDAGRGFASGDAGAGLAGIGEAVGGGAGIVGAVGSGMSAIVPDQRSRQVFRDVSRVANDVGTVARGVGQALDQGIDFITGILGEASDVDYRLTIDGCDGELNVVSVSWSERISALFSGTVEAFTQSDVTQSELLGKDIELTAERGTEQRSFRGIIRTANVRHDERGQNVVISVVPAMWLMAQTIDSRIYQDVTVPDLVEQLVRELVGNRSRTVKKDGLTETYPQHEYLVQYRESHIAFLTRLCDEEGIFFYFDHDEENEDHEVLVLADANAGLPQIRESFDGRVQFSDSDDAVGRCVARRVDHREEIGATDAVVSGYDWTNPASRVFGSRTDRGQWSGPALEVHDHFHNVRHHDYDDGGGQYQAHTADRQSRMHTERLDLARRRWTIETTVVSAAPGHTFTLEGSGDHDEEYLIVAVSAHGDSNRQGIGEIRNTIEVIPKSMPYRPPVPTRRSMPGPETATVVGEAGEEITTDRHGRVHVQFHWDRLGQNNERSSAWLRVTQQWAGPGYGMIFIPRIGMEVLVSFIGGDPDRPIVTGCLYNGQNPPPYTLPDEKTKSTIKTNSSLGGGGYNELRFEDKAGSEEVWIHAQKDFNEVVEHDHTTRVKNCQTNTVDVDQTETVGGDQSMHVVGDRTKVIEGQEMTTVMHDRNEVVNQNEFVTVDINRVHDVHGDDTLSVTGKHTVTVAGGELNTILSGQTNSVKGDRTTTVSTHDNLTVVGQHNIEVGQRHYVKHGGGATEMILTDYFHLNTANYLRLTHTMGRIEIFDAGKIICDSGISIELKCRNSSIKLTPTAIEISAPTIKIQSTGGATEIDASTQVKIKC